MAGTFHTRELVIADYDAAVNLWRDVEGIEIAEGDSMSEVANYLARNRGLSRVLQEGSVIVGVVMCGHDGRRGQIYHLAIKRTHQGRGLGRILVNECLNGLRKVGVTRAIIMVAEDNTCGRAFWRRMGWEEISGAIPMGIDL